jgi:quercetin dioxygenase-like cupin family protein
MHASTINRPPDDDTREFKNISWNLFSRLQSSERNLSVVIQRFEPGGTFANHAHDLEQWFYVTKGKMELTVGGQTRTYSEGDLVFVDRNEFHSGRNLIETDSELLVLDYWPPDSDNKLGLA